MRLKKNYTNEKPLFLYNGNTFILIFQLSGILISRCFKRFFIDKISLDIVLMSMFLCFLRSY